MVRDFLTAKYPGIVCWWTAKYFNATTSLTWRPNPESNLVVRPELRFDWFDGEGRPYDDGTKRSLVTFGMDAVWTFETMKTS